MSISRYQVMGQLGSAGGKRRGTLTIDRATGVVTVRPLGSRQTFSLMLSDLADFVVRANVVREVREEHILKKAKKAGR